MKIFKKLNRGLLMTIIVVILITAYLIIHGSMLSAKKPYIEDAANKYLSLYSEYMIHDAKVDNYAGIVNDEVIKQYASKSEQLEDLYANEKSAKAQEKTIILGAMLNISQGVDFTDYKIEIKKESMVYNFKDDNTVSVKYVVKITSTYKDANESTKTEETETDFNISMSYIKDSGWKVTYANIDANVGMGGEPVVWEKR